MVGKNVEIYVGALMGDARVARLRRSVADSRGNE
jgi:hypothetical protein